MKKFVLGVIAVAACPCTYPIYLALLGGTALGGALAAYQGWLVAGLTSVFVGAVATLVLRLVRSNSSAGVTSRPGECEHNDVDREPWNKRPRDLVTAHGRSVFSPCSPWWSRSRWRWSSSK